MLARWYRFLIAADEKQQEMLRRVAERLQELDGITPEGCAYRKCYPVRMLLKSATYKTPKIEASLVSRLGCKNVTLR
jgi:hypothetical protein